MAKLAKSAIEISPKLTSETLIKITGLLECEAV
jgi:hypothetical protein